MDTKKLVISLISLFALPSIAHANVVWPALYMETKMFSFPIIAISLVIEFFAVKWLFEVSVKRAILYTIVINLVSATIGGFLRALSGILYELTIAMIINTLFGWGTFNPVAWFFTPIIGSLVSATLELLTLRIIWKQKFTKKTFLWFWLINLLTATIATIWVVVNPPQL